MSSLSNKLPIAAFSFQNRVWPPTRDGKQLPNLGFCVKLYLFPEGFTKCICEFRRVGCHYVALPKCAMRIRGFTARRRMDVRGRAPYNEEIQLFGRTTSACPSN